MIILRTNYYSEDVNENNERAKNIGTLIGGAGVGAVGGYGLAKSLQHVPDFSLKFSGGNISKKITGKGLSKWASGNKKYFIVPGALIGTGIALNNIRKNKKK